MPKNLVIVESPAKAKTISKFLGKDFQVESCYGHIKDLPKNKLGVDIKNNFKPTYEIIPGKKKIVGRLKKLSQKTEQVYLATDLDREGETISWHLSQELNHKRAVRIIFNQITKKAIQDAVKNPGQINLNKVEAQQGRRILDRLVGYKISPLLWEKVRRGLSAGRVQSVAVKLICEREKEIEEFVPQEYWTILAEFALQRGKNLLEARLVQIEEEKAKIAGEAQARELAQRIKDEKYFIKELREEERRKFPHPPFTTSTLQQAAGSRLRLSAVRTMRIAQDLYEGQEIGEEGRVGLITYMRTDSVRVSREAQEEAREYLKREFGEDFLPPKIPYYKNKKSSQDAHEAIRPTSIWRTPEKVKGYLSRDHFKLYELIWRRFLASQMPEMVLRVITVDIQGGSYLFKAEGKRVEFPGFTLVYKERGEEEKILPPLKEGMDLKLKQITSRQHFTQPPPRYTEATLVKVLEEKGIGRPSTYAPIISTIKGRGYVRWEKGKLVPTSLGRVVNELLTRNFSTILDTGFTARMEEGLDVVEQGGEKWTVLIGEFYEHFEKDLKKAERKMRDIKKEGLKVGKVKCEKCGGEMVLKFGRYGEFLVCPKCKNTVSPVKSTGIKCPLPNCDGEIVEKLSRKGEVFYGCSKFPQCKFTSLYKPLNERCPHCDNPYLVIIKGKLTCPKCKGKVEDYLTEDLKLGDVLYRIARKRVREDEVAK